jgi:arginine:pyruvate transaminase
MRYAPTSDRLATLGGAKWEIHTRARAMKAQGRDLIELTIGEPDVPTPDSMIDIAHASMLSGRTGYSNGRGEPGLLDALAARYSARHGIRFEADRFLCLPGTQTCLFLIMMTLVAEGDEVLVGDPAYATYDGVIVASGAVPVPVPLRPENGFRLHPDDVAARITPRSRVLFLNSPHNPTGAVLSRDDIAALGALARAHDLWIVADEVYEDLVFPGVTFASPLAHPDLADRVIVTSSISKSHAAPGFRSGWCLGPAEFCTRALPLSETMLFGSQPFIADMTEAALRVPSPVAPGMAARYAHRAAMLHTALQGVSGLGVSQPDAGMFALVDVRATGLSGRDFAISLLDHESVAVMPGESFGASLAGWIRLALTQSDELTAEAARRIARHASVLAS